MTDNITNDDRNRVKLLDTVSKKGLDRLDLAQLEQLQTLLEKKDYTHSKNGQKSKLRLLAKINVAIYERSEGKQGI